MINSRKIIDLRRGVQLRLREWKKILLEEYGIDVLVYCTYRDAEQQDHLYAQGRSRRGKRITNARGWQSWHQYRIAWDAVPMVGGKPMWNDKRSYKIMGKVAMDLGIEWAGTWKSFKETAHFQYNPNNRTKAHFRNGGLL